LQFVTIVWLSCGNRAQVNNCNYHLSTKTYPVNIKLNYAPGIVILSYNYSDNISCIQHTWLDDSIFKVDESRTQYIEHIWLLVPIYSYW